MTTPLSETPDPRPRRASSTAAATFAVAGLLCVAIALFGAGDRYDTPLYLLALVLLSAWAFLFLTGYRRRRSDELEEMD